ncbi:MAG: hypothetical protein A2Y64_03410 [Candidatus Coatesbacteria bacterium RBG_13_66_14]|uniref:Uncharacterized protein n=1 Tax=Candidatus Coatesbacteria bacterium RBG_13_66_14 TaxID=1817816 RepID=A0A1F5EVS4_9BACT|nr:MAG: hypothetical protein A2Y64_03410 [Candidatus Coatesbacteria bacterium RBG_13_66_14]
MRFIPPLLVAVAVCLSCEGGTSEPVSFYPELRFEVPGPEQAPPADEVRARPIVWEIEPLPTHGGMNPQMLAGVDRLMQEHAAELTGIHAARLRADPLSSGVITANLTTESGVLLFLSLEENTTGDEALATQMLSRMQEWDWPSSGRDVFRVHLHLRRGEGGGFLDAGSRELRPLPEIPPPPVEEEKPAEGETAPEDRLAQSEESLSALP